MQEARATKIVISYGRKRCVNYDTLDLHITEEFEIPVGWSKEQVEQYEADCVDGLMQYVDGIANQHG